MGLRYRKSINFGGGFRVNISNSGVSYSWGKKGFRITKTARGTVRKTYSIPGTGISYTQESPSINKKSQSPNAKHISAGMNYYDTQNIENGSASQIASDGLEDLLQAANFTFSMDLVASFVLAASICISFLYPPMFLFSLLPLIFKAYVRTKGLVDLEYSIDDDQQQSISDRMLPMTRMSQSNKLWRITQLSTVVDRKYSSGAGQSVHRVPCVSSSEVPFPFKCNVPTISFKSKKETLLFLPDKLFIIQGRSVGALNYSDIQITANASQFVEDSGVPKDAVIVDWTWKYVNKSGGPDRRFKNNPKFPVCLYGNLHLTADSGLNTIIMFSNVNLK